MAEKSFPRWWWTRVFDWMRDPPADPHPNTPSSELSDARRLTALEDRMTNMVLAHGELAKRVEQVNKRVDALFTVLPEHKRRIDDQQKVVEDQVHELAGVRKELSRLGNRMTLSAALLSQPIEGVEPE